MISEFLFVELRKIGLAMGFGAALTIVYDVLRIIRNIIPHNTVAYSTEDLLFFICLSPVAFWFVLAINDGIFRLYIILGIILGVFVYRETLGRLIVKILSFIMGKVVKIHIFLLKKITENIRMKVTKQKEKKRRRQREKQKIVQAKEDI